MTRTKKSFINMLFASVKSLIMMVLGLWTTPWIIRLIGAEDFGRFKAMLEFLGYLGVIFSGIYGGLIILLNQLNAKPVSEHEKSLERHAVFSEAIKRYFYMSCASLFGGILLIWPASHVLKVPIGEFLTIGPFSLTYYSILFCNFLMIGQVFQADLDSRMRNDLVQIGLFIQAIVTIIVTIVTAQKGAGIMANGYGMLLGYLISGCFFYAASSTNISVLVQRLFTHNVSDIKSTGLFKTSLLNNVAIKIANFSDYIVVSLFAGPVIVTNFFLTQRLLSILQPNLSMLGGAVWAGLGDLYHSGESLERMKVSIVRLTRIQTYIGICAIVPCMVYNDSFVSLWVGQQHFLTKSIGVAAGVCVLQQTILSLWSWILIAIGKPNLMTQWLWAQAGINLILSLLLTYYLGPIGPILGTILSSTLVTMWKFPQMISSELKMPQWPVYRSWGEGFILGLTGYVAFEYFRVEIHGFLDLIMILSAKAGLIAMCGFFLLLRRDDRHLLYGVLKRFIKRA